MSAWVRDNVIWLLGLLPFLFVSYKLTVISGGDTAKMLALLNATNPVNLIIASLFPWLPLVVLYSGVWVWEWRRRQSKEFKKKTQQYVGFGLLLVVLPALSAMPLGMLVVVVGVLTVQYGTLAFRVRKGRIKWSDYRIDVWFALVMVVVYMITSASISWMPREIIKIQGRDAVVGYVISSDPRWLVYMEHRGPLHTVPATTVETRTNCNESKDWFLKSLTGVWTNIKSNPDCPR